MVVVAVGLSLPWLQLDTGGGVSTSGTPLLAVSSLLAAVTLGALVLSPARGYTAFGATLLWGFAMYGGIALLRGLPTYAAVHFGSEGAVGLGIPLTLFGSSLLLVAAWAGVALRPHRRPEPSGTHETVP